MADLVAGWTEENRTFLVQREGDATKTRVVPARWSLFATGLDDSDRAAIARDKRVVGMSSDGERYTRIDCRNRWARKDITEILEKAARQAPGLHILEADVSPLRRLLSDVPSLQIHETPRAAYLDLEVDSRRSFIAMKGGEARILSWAVVDQVGKVQAGILSDDTDAAERALIRDLIVALCDFDLVLAWNGDGFDFLVLQKRVEALGSIQVNGRDIQWSRWCWLDHLAVFKKYNMHSDGGGEEKTSFKLGHVANYLLGEGKDDFDASKTWEAWEAGGEERARLLRYNIKDTTLLPKIEEKTGFLALHLAVCSICRVFPDTFSLNATAQGDGFMLALGAEHGWRWATRRRFEEGMAPAPFKGAYVMEPTRLGAIDSVHVADFAGLYPSIMRTWNMSPDTKVKNPGGASGLLKLPNRETYFRGDRDGMFRIALDQLVAKRAEYTNEMKNHTPGDPAHARAKRLSGAFKIVANSFYGITGSPFSRFFDVEIAEGVTQTGRWLLENVIDESKLKGLDPFYGDTDSVFVSGDGGKFREVVKSLNADWGRRLEPFGVKRHHIDLDFEKTFKRLIIVSAKRYAGRFEMYKGKAASPDAKPEVKGLEFKRGDTIRLARDMQSEVVNRLLEDELPPPGAILEILDRWRAQVLEAPLELADLAITQSLSKRVEEYADRFTLDRCVHPQCDHQFGSVDPKGPDACPKCMRPRARTSVPAHVRVAKLLQARGTPLGEGDRVSYVIVGRAEGRMDVIPSTDPDALERADRTYYWEDRVFPATSRVLEHVYPGSSWGESKGDRKQRVLETAGQTRLDFATSPGTVRRRKVQAAPTAPTEGAPKVRRKKKAAAPALCPVSKITVTLIEGSEAEDGGFEASRRRVVLQAIKAAIEAYPGPVPVELVIKLRDMKPDDSGSHPETVKVTIPTGLGIEKSTRARVALERVVARPEQVSGF